MLIRYPGMNRILGIATSRPEHRVLQEEAAALALGYSGSERADRLLPHLYSKTKIERRSTLFAPGSAEGDKGFGAFFTRPQNDSQRGPGTAARLEQYRIKAPGMALEASREALKRSTTATSDIRHLITVSCTGFNAPGFDITLIRELGLDPTVSRTHIGFMGCQGLFNALRAADGLIQAHGGKALICSVELCSVHFQYGSVPDHLLANALFADGAGAMVFGSGESGGGPAAAGGWHYAGQRSCVIPNTEPMMSWTIGDHGFVMGLSPEVPGVIRSMLKDWIDGWLGSMGLTASEIGTWAVHPGGPRILGACREALGLDEEATRLSMSVMADHGNMSSATLFFVLERALEQKSPVPCVSLGFGPGLSVEAALWT